MENGKKIILSLCGGTGAWERPYKDAGYNVITITLPDYDVKNYKIIHNSGNRTLIFEHIADKEPYFFAIPIKNIYGILAAPPCTMFSFARTNAKRSRDLEEGMQCVRACLDIIWKCMEVEQDTTKKTIPLKFWALENPYFGFLKSFLGKPAFIFDPWEFGDGYQKRTAIWGNFNEPIKNPIPMTEEAKAKTNSYLHTMGKNKEKCSSCGEEFFKGETLAQAIHYATHNDGWKKRDDLVKFDKLASKDIHSEAFGKWDRQARRSITPAGFSNAFYKSNP